MCMQKKGTVNPTADLNHIFPSGQETLIARQQAEIARLKRLLDNKTQR